MVCLACPSPSLSFFLVLCPLHGTIWTQRICDSCDHGPAQDVESLTCRREDESVRNSVMANFLLHASLFSRLLAILKTSDVAPLIQASIRCGVLGKLWGICASWHSLPSRGHTCRSVVLVG